MKKTLSLFLAATMILAACKKETPIVYSAGSLEYFGFKAVDNPVLPNDVTVESPAAGEIKFTFPTGTSTETLKTLVPDFKLKADVQVDGTLPKLVVGEKTVSLGDALDFSAPLDMYVVVGDVKTLYTIAVVVKAAPRWAVKAVSETEIYGDSPSFVVGQKTGALYVAGLTNSATTADRKAVAYKVTNTFASLSSTGYASAARANYVTIDVDVDDNPFVVFADYEGGNPTATNGATVVKFENSAAVAVGGSKSIYNPGDEPALIPVGNKELWVALRANAASGNVPRRALALSKYDGSAWTPEVALEGRTASDYGYYPKHVRTADADYLFVFNQNNNSISCYKLANGSWSTVVESLTIKKTGTDEVASINMYPCTRSYDVDSKGNIYICAYAQIAEDYKEVLVRYEPDTKKSTVIGGSMNFEMGSRPYACFALDEFDTPYIVFVNGTTKKLNMSYIDTSTKIWSEAVQIYDQDLSNGTASSTSPTPVLDFFGSKAYVCVSSVATHKITVLETVE